MLSVIILRIESNNIAEVCGAQTQNSCAEDCCGMTRFDYYPGTYTHKLHVAREVFTQCVVIGVCGNGLCDGNETCSDCPGDCGLCPQCGDGQCNGLDTCTGCPEDCGECPQLYNAQCVYPVPRGTQTPIPVPVPVAPVAPPVMPPYALAVNVIPGIIEAENYDFGGENVAYYDTTPGNAGGDLRTDDVDIQVCNEGFNCVAVVNIEAGEWLEYAVQVEQDGLYAIDARYAYPDGTPVTAARLVAVKIDGAQVAQLSLAPSGGWAAWAYCPTVNVPLTAGNHVLRLEFGQGWWSFNFVRFTLLPPAPPVEPIPVPVPVPVSVPVDPPVTATPIAVTAPNPVPVAAPMNAPTGSKEPISAGIAPQPQPPIETPVFQAPSLDSCANELLSGLFTIVLVFICFA